MSDTSLTCPRCSSSQIVKNGFIHNGHQNFKCKDCSRQFVQNPTKKMIGQETRNLIDAFTAGKGVVGRNCQSYWGIRAVVADICKRLVQSRSQGSRSLAQKKRRLNIQCDEMWSFVLNKKNKQWVWLALDANTQEIVGVYVGERNRKGAKGLWQSLPAVYRQCAMCYTDFWSAYEQVFPKFRHQAVSKKSGKTNHIERLNCTLRQRISRLVRQTLSFSKKLENHIGAIWYFIHYHNESLLM